VPLGKALGRKALKKLDFEFKGHWLIFFFGIEILINFSENINDRTLSTLLQSLMKIDSLQYIFLQFLDSVNY